MEVGRSPITGFFGGCRVAGGGHFLTELNSREYTSGMSSLIPKVIVIGLLAAVSPVSLMVLIAVMLRKKPLRNAFFFLIGYTIMLLIIGLVFGLVLHAGGSGKKSKLDSYVDVGLGALCLRLIPLSFRKRKKPAKEEPGALSPPRAIITGAVVMSVNISTVMAYLVGVHTITRANLPTGDDLVAWVILTLFALLSMLVPIAMDVAFPRTAARVLKATRAWLIKYNQWGGGAVLLLFGVILLFQGIKALV